MEKHHAPVDAASLLVIQQTIVTVPERPRPVPKLCALPARVSLLPSFIHLVRILHKESDKEQIRVLHYHEIIPKRRTLSLLLILVQRPGQTLEGAGRASSWAACCCYGRERKRNVICKLLIGYKEATEVESTVCTATTSPPCHSLP